MAHELFQKVTTMLLVLTIRIVAIFTDGHEAHEVNDNKQNVPYFFIMMWLI